MQRLQRDKQIHYLKIFVPGLGVPSGSRYYGTTVVHMTQVILVWSPDYVCDS